MFKHIAYLVVIVVITGLGLWWFLNRPTPQEVAVEGFFDHFRMGRYSDAEALTVNDDFFEMAISTTVKDTDGAEYEIRQYYPSARRFDMQYGIETWVRAHIAKWKMRSMETTELDDTHASVHFRLDLSIREFQGSSQPFGDIREGTIEGNVSMLNEEGQWVVEKFDLVLISDQGFRMADYLSRSVY